MFTLFLLAFLLIVWLFFENIETKIKVALVSTKVFKEHAQLAFSIILSPIT